MPTLAGHPKEIGPYEVLDVLGTGGVGAVYLAEQDGALSRRVAIKLVKLGMDTREILARFNLESQSMALMNHPNIAKVFESGETSSGRPYFVMEYVPGAPITDYCDVQRLDIAERLQLFVTVCRGVQHAHQKGVIHRDLKPSNILVTLRDGVATPVIIDFGLAKAIRGEPASMAGLTQQGQMLGTPQYMSPEQIESSDTEVDTRADIYALGVLLYELLIGVRPHERKFTQDGRLGFAKSVREEESSKPSTRLDELESEIAAIAEKRRTDRESLLKQVRGDLDWIALKALEKDPERRYVTVSELASDVERFLRKEPVLARPSSSGYRLERFFARHRTEVIVAILLVLAMVTGSTVSTVLHLQAGTSRSETEVVIRVCESMQKEIANAHLWFEEAISGDETLDVEDDVYRLLRRSMDSVELALLGGESPFGQVLPVHSKSAAADLRTLRSELMSYLRLTEERWKNKDTSGKPGGPLDHKYDAAYIELLELSNGVVDELQMRSVEDWERSARAGILANLLTLVSVVVGLVTGLRSLSKRA